MSLPPIIYTFPVKGDMVLYKDSGEYWPAVVINQNVDGSLDLVAMGVGATATEVDNVPFDPWSDAADGTWVHRNEIYEAGVDDPPPAGVFGLQADAPRNLYFRE